MAKHPNEMTTAEKWEVFDHPECLDGEIFWMNASTEMFASIKGWKTKRLGDVAYDCDGKTTDVRRDPMRFRGVAEKTDYLDVHPVFVKRSEVQEKHDSATEDYMKEEYAKMLKRRNYWGAYHNEKANGGTL